MNMYISWYPRVGSREQRRIDVEVRRGRRDTIVAEKNRKSIMYKAKLCAQYSQTMCLLPDFCVL